MNNDDLRKKLFEQIEGFVDRKDAENLKRVQKLMQKVVSLLKDDTKALFSLVESTQKEEITKVKETLNDTEKNLAELKLEGRNFQELQEKEKEKLKKKFTEIKQQFSEISETLQKFESLQGAISEEIRTIETIRGEDGKDGSPDTPQEIKEKLETLKGQDRLDASAIKNLEENIDATKLQFVVSIPSAEKIVQSVRITNTDYNLALDQVVVFTATATATLPPATGTGITYRIVCRSGIVTIIGTGTDTIKGESSQQLFEGEDLILTDTESGIWE